MRTVSLYLRDASLPEVVAELAKLCPKPAGPPWVWFGDGEPCLYISCLPARSRVTRKNVVRDAEVTSVLGRVPTARIYIDVARGHSGEAEVRAFAAALLGQFRGVAQDVFTSHCWTLEEILSRQKIQLHVFFDYKGWYAEKQAQRRMTGALPG